MTITLPPATELLLRERAEKEHRTPDEVAVSILDEALHLEPETLEESVSRMQDAIRDGEEGRTRSLDEYIAAVRDRERLPPEWPEKVAGYEPTAGVFIVKD